MKKQLSTKPYKGSRDFYPEDMRIQEYLYSTWDRVCRRFGFEKYDFPFLEPLDLYRAKSGEEIVNDQLYSFKDRGSREIAIRPEATPSVARMVAGRLEELPKPIRWYSYPNLWRYERPQKGRLREHYQLNADIFGPDNVEADAEAILLSIAILKEFGANDDHFIVYINNRKITNYILRTELKLNDKQAYQVSKAIDKKAKIKEVEFNNLLSTAGLTNTQIDNLNAFLVTKTLSLSKFDDVDGVADLQKLLNILSANGVSNICEYNPLIMRGFDYYTGTVFEVFDRSPQNNRSLFGGGRYDDLLNIFDKPKLPAVGFGMGDVTLRLFLEIHELLPKLNQETLVLVTMFDEQGRDFTFTAANLLRESQINTAIYPSSEKISKQLRYASKQGIPYVLIQGPDEREKNEWVLKDMQKETQETLSLDGIIQRLKAH